MEKSLYTIIILIVYTAIGSDLPPAHVPGYSPYDYITPEDRAQAKHQVLFSTQHKVLLGVDERIFGLALACIIVYGGYKLSKYIYNNVSDNCNYKVKKTNQILDQIDEIEQSIQRMVQKKTAATQQESQQLDEILEKLKKRKEFNIEKINNML